MLVANESIALKTRGIMLTSRISNSRTGLFPAEGRASMMFFLLCHCFIHHQQFTCVVEQIIANVSKIILLKSLLFWHFMQKHCTTAFQCDWVQLSNAHTCGVSAMPTGYLCNVEMLQGLLNGVVLFQSVCSKVQS